MKKLLFLFIFQLISSPVKAESFPWIIFLPAINKHVVNTTLSCIDVQGSYQGEFTDNCPGIIMSGVMYISLKSDCSFSGYSNWMVGIKGKITSRADTVYTGYGTTDSSGCGPFSIVCNNGYDFISCNYTYGNGRSGSIPYAARVP